MGEVSGIEVIRQKMLEIYARAASSRQLDTSEIARELEPLFQAYGYRAPAEGAPRRILLLHDDGVGDFINCSVAIREVRRAYPEAYITLVVFAPSYDMAVTCPYVDQVLADARKCDWRNPLALFRWHIDMVARLLPMHYDAAVHFTVRGSSVLLSYLSGAARRIGYVLAADALSGPFHADVVQGFVTDFVPSIGRGTHSVYRYLPLIEHFTKQETEDCRPEIWTLAQETRWWQEALRQRGAGARWIAVVIGASSGRRHWPITSYVELLQRIFEEEVGDVRFLLLGGSGDREDAGTLARALPEQAVWNAAGQGSWRNSAAALRCCELYIGNDTGLMHAAAASCLPVLSPCCYPADLPMAFNAVPLVHYPYGVPAVFARPAHALPECRASKDIWGCAADHPHCITQVTPGLMLRGYHVLKEQIRQGRTDLLFLYEMDNPTHDGTVTAIEPLDVSRFEIEDA